MRRHNYRATWKDHGPEVTDPEGNKINVKYGGTTDSRTLYAYVDGVGFIGGWQYPHRKLSFRNLVTSINQGIVYDHSAELPNGRSNQRRRV